jgi:hypothetical protein
MQNIFNGLSSCLIAVEKQVNTYFYFLKSLAAFIKIQQKIVGILEGIITTYIYHNPSASSIQNMIAYFVKIL